MQRALAAAAHKFFWQLSGCLFVEKVEVSLFWDVARIGKLLAMRSRILRR